MPDLKVADLDALAAEHDVADYPSSGNKAEKAAALEAAGVALVAIDPPHVYRLRLTEGVEAASFQADHQAVELTAENPLFETSKQRIYLQARDLPFLEEVA